MVMITPTLIEDLAWKGYLVFMALNFVFVPVFFDSFPMEEERKGIRRANDYRSSTSFTPRRRICR